MTSIVSVREAEFRGTVLLGATGRLGRMLRSFWPDGNLVAVGRTAGTGIERCDILQDKAVLQGLLAGHRAVVCLAGITDAAARRGAPMSHNSDLAMAAIHAAKAAGAGRVFLASSAAVYGRQSGLLTEDSTLAPLAEYGRAKCEMEQAGLALGAQIGQAVTVLRIGNVAGADAILGGWHEGMRIDQLPDGSTPARSYIGPQALARVIAGLATKAKLPSVLNVAGPGVVEMGALLDAAGLPWAPRPAPDGVIRKVALSTQELARYVPLTDTTAQGLVAEWLRYREMAG
ncbi:NAD-dependent epimerase/dehydratase family protein [Sulfitobacter sp. JB4-11]|uniref:NAD-dependent epimerase/dehydratase family protein n=1 Tax=Sulfitobacter rhodophyticola TaxID=3238304 RepID=UPI003A5DE214